MIGNELNQKIAAAQYNRQRKDSLADWNMQNEYNSPSAQMQRYKDAGLNPHLIYGNAQGATAAMPRGSDLASVSKEAANAQAPQGAMGFYDAQVKQDQANNLQAQLDVIKQQKELMAAQTAAQLLGIDMKKLDLGQKSKLQPIQLEAAIVQLNKSKADTDFTIAENRRKEELHPGNLTEQKNRITQQVLQHGKTTLEKQELEKRLKMIDLDLIVRGLDAKLAAQGIRPHDPIREQVLKKAVDTIVDMGQTLPTNPTMVNTWLELWIRKFLGESGEKK